nr:stress response protein NST1-like isoform X1 [Megalopta genalis]
MLLYTKRPKSGSKKNGLSMAHTAFNLLIQLAPTRENAVPDRCSLGLNCPRSLREHNNYDCLSEVYRGRSPAKPKKSLGPSGGGELLSLAGVDLAATVCQDHSIHLERVEDRLLLLCSPGQRLSRMMLPGVTVVPATVWLAVCVAVVGASNPQSSRLTPDQYAPWISHRHGLHRRTEEDQPFVKFPNESDEDLSIEDSISLHSKGRGPAEKQPVSISISSYWKDQGAAGNGSSDLTISPRRSPDTSIDSQERSELIKHLEKELLSFGMRNSAAEDFSPLLQDKQLLRYNGQKFLDQNINVEESSVPARSPPQESQSEDPFVADDTFQDQGPGSVEIYKLDLLRERLLPNPMPTSKLPMNAKRKVPKKTSHSNEKTKATDYKASNPKLVHKQSNSFDDHSSDAPPNTDPFSIGGVPELQVGCEGLADSRQKRSIDSVSKNDEGDLWSEVTPISLDLDYDLSEEKFEEMDELFKLKKLETTTKGMKQNRGDIDVTLYAEFQDDEKHAEKLPVRGDLGESSATTDFATLTPMPHRNERKAKEKLDSVRAKRSVQFEGAEAVTGQRTANQVRKILWVKEPTVNDLSENREPQKRDMWGFGEEEGVVSSDELQTENQRRRQFYERRRKEEELRRQGEELRRQQESQRRGQIANRTDADIEKIRSDYEKQLEQRRQEESRRLSQISPTRRPEREDERRRRLESETNRNRMMEEARRRTEGFRRRQESWPPTPSSGRQLQEEEARRRQKEDRVNLEDRRREWMLKRRQEMEEERRKQARDRSQPSNVPAGANESGSRGQWERDQKLREYIERNRPVNVDGAVDRRTQEENRRRLDEERKLQEYIRRNQPVQVPRNASYDWMMHRRKVEQAGGDDRSRYPSLGGARRDHGPSATANVNPRSYADEARRRNAARKTEEERIRERERLQEESRRREQEVRRSQSRWYEEQRQRMLVERRKQEYPGKTSSPENMGPLNGDRRRFEDHRGRQETSLVPSNLVANEARRSTELERQRMEMERRRRIEAERERAENRAKEARESQERARATKEQWRRQEEARLNSLPVIASIIIRPEASATAPTQGVIPQSRFGDSIEFTGFNPHRKGMEVPNFPAAPTRRPPVKSPPPCVWAVVQCCPTNVKRLVTCFESMGCPGINWDPNPCRISVTQAAREQVMKFYEEVEEDRRL